MALLQQPSAIQKRVVNGDRLPFRKHLDDFTRVGPSEINPLINLEISMLTIL